jgi:branched-chain amino acid aminotransferase
MTKTHPRYAYFEGNIVPIEQAKISVMTHAFNYGTGVFGGLRGYWNAEVEQLYVFRPLDHMKRLLQSAQLLRMDIPHTPQSLTEVVQDLLRAEGYVQNCYIRPVVYKSEAAIGVRLHDLSADVTAFSLPMGAYLKMDGIHAHISAWRRVDDNMIPARGKVTGAYANSSLIKTDAVLSGYDEAIVLNEDGHLSEASAANLFMVRGGTVITPPITANVLEGIVRRSVMQLIQDEMGLPVEERDIDRTEIYLADEAFLCGTGVQIAGMTKIDHRPLGDGALGPVTKQITALFMDVVHGRHERYSDWVLPVYEAEAIGD